MWHAYSRWGHRELGEYGHVKKRRMDEGVGNGMRIQAWTVCHELTRYSHGVVLFEMIKTRCVNEGVGNGMHIPGRAVTSSVRKRQVDEGVGNGMHIRGRKW